MSGNSFLLLIAFFLSHYSTSVNGAGSSPCIANGRYIAGSDCFPNKSSVSVAEHFNITYSKTFKVLLYNNPASGVRRYAVLYQRGTARPSAADAGIPDLPASIPFIEIPVTKVAVQSTTSLTFFEYLGRRSSVRALISGSNNSTVDPRDYVTSACYLRLRSEGRFFPIAIYETHDWTQYDVVFVSNTYEPDSYLLNNLSNAVVFAPHLDPGTLQRLEWLEAAAAFFNLEGSANTVITKATARYSCHRDLAWNSMKKRVGWIQFYRGVLYESSGSAYKQDLVTNASGRIIKICTRPFGCTLTKSVNTTALQLVQVLIVENANYNFSTFEATLSAVANQQVLGSLPFMQSREVYSIDGLQGPHGGVDWLESSLVEPDAQLRDLISVIHPALLPSHKRVWLRRIANEKITKTSASQCIRVDADLVVKNEGRLDSCSTSSGQGCAVPSLLVQGLVSFIPAFALILRVMIV